MKLKPMKILGLMSGTSIDGLDLALCTFSHSEDRWNYKIIQTETIQYASGIKDKLKNSMELSSADLVKLDHEFGMMIGGICVDFLQRTGESAELIASHGHTVFHNPSKSYTLQIGNGHDIVAGCGIPVIYDFRSMDIALGGQGAPLVPVGDNLLFSEYAACLNLGGFSNISYNSAGKRIAYDICPLNIALNYLAEKLHKEYDEDGQSGREGKVIEELFEKLEKIQFYSAPAPKTLGKEWFINHFRDFLSIKAEIKDIMRTVYEHLSQRISMELSQFADKDVLISGGGAHNSFLMELIKRKSMCNIVLPDKIVIDFKEAIIFGFLGYLRYHNVNNTLKSVTGAERDSCGGLLVNPHSGKKS